MPDENFKSMCPNLFKAIMDNQYTDEVYGVKFKTHTALTRHQIIEKVEDCRAIIYWSPEILNEPMLIVLN